MQLFSYDKIWNFIMAERKKISHEERLSSAGRKGDCRWFWGK